MDQGKSDVVKQEMARVYINILGWMGMGELNANNHYIYFHGQESLRRNGVILIERLNKRV